MRNTLMIATTLCISSALIGCNSKTSPSGAPEKVNPPHQQNSATGKWAVKLKSTCTGDVGQDNCLAGHGFSVEEDGRFKAGPGPGNEVRIGALEADELDALKAALTPALTASENPSPKTEALEEASQNEDTVTVYLDSRDPQEIVKAQGTDLTFQTKSAKEAQSLLAEMRKLAVKYYRLPFPDSCVDGANSLQALFSASQGCSNDSECAYMNYSFEDSSNSFKPASVNSLQEIIIDDCHVVKPFAVGNLELTLKNSAQLKEGLEKFRSECTTKVTRDDCTQFIYHPLSGPAPVCKQGVCRVGTAQ